jgi:hypothetical protein
VGVEIGQGRGDELLGRRPAPDQQEGAALQQRSFGRDERRELGIARR